MKLSYRTRLVARQVAFLVLCATSLLTAHKSVQATIAWCAFAGFCWNRFDKAVSFLATLSRLMRENPRGRNPNHQ